MDASAIEDYFAGRAKDSKEGNQDISPMRARMAGGNGGFPLIGTPREIVDGLVAMREAGVSGVALSFLNFLDELPFFIAEVLPLWRKTNRRLAEVG